MGSSDGLHWPLSASQVSSGNLDFDGPTYELKRPDAGGGFYIGPYDVLNPEDAGGTFEFVMRDRDGIPVVNEWIGGTERINQFRAELVYAERWMQSLCQ